MLAEAHDSASDAQSFDGAIALTSLSITYGHERECDRKDWSEDENEVRSEEVPVRSSPLKPCW